MDEASGPTVGPAGVISGVGIPANVPTRPTSIDTFDIMCKRTNSC